MVNRCYTILNTNAASGRRAQRIVFDPSHTVYLQMQDQRAIESLKPKRRPLRSILISNLIAALFAVVIFYFSMVMSSMPVTAEQQAVIDRAIAVLEAKGFEREVFLLRHTASFRGTDNWLNRAIFKENAFAATNFPVQMITIYPDFYNKAEDDTERAMVLLHEAQHLQGADEHEAYAYVWRNRTKLGWTRDEYGGTATYIDVSGATRDNAPELFKCTFQPGQDCTERAYTARETPGPQAPRLR